MFWLESKWLQEEKKTDLSLLILIRNWPKANNFKILKIFQIFSFKISSFFLQNKFYLLTNSKWSLKSKNETQKGFAKKLNTTKSQVTGIVRWQWFGFIFSSFLINKRKLLLIVFCSEFKISASILRMFDYLFIV